MSVRACILGVLTVAPTYGHQILFEIENRLPHRRGVNPGQVYSTLARLVSSGHLTSDDSVSQKLPVYHLTDIGRSEADLWLQGATEIDVDDWAEVKDAVLLCASLPHASPDRLIASIRTACNASTTDTEPSSGVSPRLSADATRIHRRGVAEWLDVVGAAISAGEITAHPFADDRPGRGRRPKSAGTTD